MRYKWVIELFLIFNLKDWVFFVLSLRSPLSAHQSAFTQERRSPGFDELSLVYLRKCLPIFDYKQINYRECRLFENRLLWLIVVVS